MEHAVIRSDLKKRDIHPQALLDKYLLLLRKDIKKMLGIESLQHESCPVTSEKGVRLSFSKMGMQYNVSKTFGNIYLSPRPKMETLIAFYRESSARKFWLTEIWPKTRVMREEKIINQQMEWVRGFISQYCNERKLSVAEYFPNHWGYLLHARSLWAEIDYKLIDPLFNLDITLGEVSASDINDNTVSNKLDAVLLFETLDRSVNPMDILTKVNNMLKPGGLCFITCHLSSGFEIQVLGQNSELFVPPERMNILSFEGMNALIDKLSDFESLEFSTPGVLDIANVQRKLDEIDGENFLQYILKQRHDQSLISSFQDFLQANCLGTFGRLVLIKT